MIHRQRFALSGLPVTKVAINFDSAEGNLTDWMISRCSNYFSVHRP